MNLFSFLWEYWPVILVALPSMAAMVALSFWLGRCRDDRSYLTLTWILFLLILGVGSWYIHQEVAVFRETWKEDLLRAEKLDIMARQVPLITAFLFASVVSLYLVGVFVIAALRQTLRKISEENRELTGAKKFADLAARAKSDFLANMSHEIRTPMNAVLGFTDILTQRLAQRGTSQDREDLDKIVDIIRKNSDDLLMIVNDILDYSRMDANLLEVESVPVAIKQIIEDIRQMVLPAVQAKFLDFSIEYREPIPELILSDPTRLRQILMNLISNAIKFTDKGHIHIVGSTIIGQETTEPESVGGKKLPAPMILRIDVIDTGIGISVAQSKNIFAPFTQADTSSTRKFGGTGIGLSIARKLAVLLDGDITVTSKPGFGSTFSLLVHVYLPTQEALRLAKAKEDAAKRGSGFSTSDVDVRLLDTVTIPLDALRPLDGVRVLLVEDMAVNQLVVSMQLKEAGARVETASNGEDGVQRINADADNGLFFDIILMDMQMPVMDGYEATRILREQGYKQPIIATTAHALSGDREKTIEAGCDDYIAKPIDRKVLIETIKKHLK